MTLVEVFVSDGTNTSISLQPRLVSWSLNIYGLVCRQLFFTYVSAYPKGFEVLHFQ